jgi:hypothetical protein
MIWLSMQGIPLPEPSGATRDNIRSSSIASFVTPLCIIQSQALSTPFYDAASVRLLKPSTAVKAKASAPPLFNSSSSAALTRRALERVARTGGDAVAALRQTADRQGRQQGEVHGRQEGRTWGPLRRLQQSGPPCPLPRFLVLLVLGPMSARRSPSAACRIRLGLGMWSFPGMLVSFFVQHRSQARRGSGLEKRAV